MKRKKGGLFTEEAKAMLTVIATLALWVAVLVQVVENLSR